MKNVEMKIDGTILTITVDLAKEFGPSASGKTIIIASTEGNVPVLDRDEKIDRFFVSVEGEELSVEARDKEPVGQAD